MRTEIVLNIKCSICGETLEADNEKSGKHCDSAYNLTTDIAIKPCRVCYYKAKEPLELLKKALEKATEEVKNE